MTKSNKDCVFDGVCGGIAEHFEIDVTLVRIVFLLGQLYLLYIILMMIMTESEIVENN